MDGNYDFVFQKQQS